MEQPAILVRDLRKAFGPMPILRGVDLAVAPGERLALFGANGAGKTTLIRILATLVRPSAGMVSVAGCRLEAESAELRRHIGVVTQPDLSVWRPHGHREPALLRPPLRRDRSGRAHLRLA